MTKKTKTWGSISGVNITCGLPIIRVSVDHGTAFGKAGEGRANPESMIQAIRIAAQLAVKVKSINMTTFMRFLKQLDHLFLIFPLTII